MTKTSALACSFCILIAIFLPAEGQELPTTLRCTSNAKVSRDYAFTVKQWSGHKGHDLNPSDPFKIVQDRNAKPSLGQFSLRDKVFVGMDTNTPTVVSITRWENRDDLAEEFRATVVSRTSDTVFIVWTDRYPGPSDFGNRAWLAVVDLTHRKVIVTHVVQGATSVIGELETPDCR